jgi:hypothetical protein
MRGISRIATLTILFAATLAGAQVAVNSFDGIDATTPGSGAILRVVDPNGAVGTKQYLEWIDTAYQGYDKTTFAPVYTTLPPGDTPWAQAGEVNCEGAAGNGVIIFDHLASRWVIAVRQGSSATGIYYFCVAVSNTDDLTASNFAWNAYAIPLDNLLGTNAQGITYFPDYPKIATWADGYYTTIDLEDPSNKYTEVGTLVCALDRSNMLIGGTPRTPQCFRYPRSPSGLFLGHSLLPADIEGKLAPPAGMAEYLVSIQNPNNTNTSKLLNFWIFHVNWTTPSLTTFTGPKTVTVPAYIPGCYDVAAPTNTVCVPEPSTSLTNNYIDSVGDRVMHRFAYRRFTATTPYQTFLLSQAVQVGSGSASQTGIRWYEFNSGGGLMTSGTINPADGNYRFMPSVAQDSAGNLAVGYSVSGTAKHPGIAASYLNLRGGSLTPTEFTILSGTADEENAYHWGGYTSMTVDPVDDCTFWYVNEYLTMPQIGSLVSWQTRISNFKLPSCPPVTSLRPVTLRR